MTNEVSEGRRARASEKLDRAKSKVRETTSAARARASEAYDSASMKAGRAYDATRRSASSAGRRTAQGVDDSPLAVLFGGLALGAIAGALLPRTRREAEALGPIGRKVNETAASAARAAREAGSEKLDAMGINRTNARAQVDKLAHNAAEAAATASKAAARSVRQNKPA